jgi:molybdopterin-containing oxidoreductase family iron-sulfur binding subunit
VQISLDWQGGGLMLVMLKAKAGKMSRHFQLEANMTLSGAAICLLQIKNKH